MTEEEETTVDGGVWQDVDRWIERVLLTSATNQFDDVTIGLSPDQTEIVATPPWWATVQLPPLEAKRKNLLTRSLATLLQGKTPVALRGAQRSSRGSFAFKRGTLQVTVELRYGGESRDEGATAPLSLRLTAH